MKNLKKMVLVSGVVLLAAQSAHAHTRLQVPHLDENSANHGSDYNNEVIAHGCTDAETGERIPVIGSAVVFPDGVDSTITENGEASDKTLFDFVPNYGSPVSLIQSNDVFAVQDEISDSLGNNLGFWSADGALKTNLTGVIPFRTSGVVIEPTSCATSVKFVVSIADVCVVTDKAGFTAESVNLWTPAVGSDFDVEGNPGYDSPASLTVNRTASELPEECGDGVEVVVTPSAAQLNRDFVVNDKSGAQVWPLP